MVEELTKKQNLVVVPLNDSGLLVDVALIKMKMMNG